MNIQIFDTGYGVNTYLLTCGNNAVVIDPCFELDELCSRLKNDKLILRAILATHGHFDHVGGAAILGELFGCNIYIHEKEFSMLESSDFTFSDFGEPIRVKNFSPVLFNNESELSFEGMPKFEVLATPGHTPGGVCFLLKQERVLFSGDTLFRHGYGRTDFRFACESDLFASLKTVLNLKENYTVYPGHGASTTVNEERVFFAAAIGI